MQGPKVVEEGLLGNASWVSIDGLFSQKQKNAQMSLALVSFVLRGSLLTFCKEMHDDLKMHRRSLFLNNSPSCV